MPSGRIKIKSTEKVEKDDRSDEEKKRQEQKMNDIARPEQPYCRTPSRHFDQKVPTADELERLEKELPCGGEGPKWGYFDDRPKYQLVSKSDADKYLAEKKSTQKEFDEKFDKLYGKGAKKEKMASTRSEAVVLLLDCSGSMSEPFGAGTKIDALKYAVFKFFERKELIKDMDHVGVVGYGLKGDKKLRLGSEGGVINPYSPVVIISNITRDYQHILQNVSTMLRAEGGTPMEDGLVVAYNLLREFQLPACQHRIILISDGKAEDAKAVRMRGMKIAAFGVVIDTVSMGNQENIDEATLIELANLSKGEYRYAANVEMLWQTYDYLATKKPF